MTANTYTYEGPGTRWAEEDPTAEDYLNVSRINADHLHEALNTIMDTDNPDTGFIKSYPEGVEAAENTTTTSGLIIVDLDDPDTIWDLDKFMQQARHTSWYDELGAPPVHGVMWIINSRGTFKWWDRETGATYMSFETNADDMISETTMNAMMFLDGKIYVAADSDGVRVVDLLRDTGYAFDTTGFSVYNGDVSERNDGSGITLLDPAIALANATVYDIDAVRDRFGRVDEFGRPVHWWAEASDDAANGRLSVYNARDNAIYDSSQTVRFRSVAISPVTGQVFAGEVSAAESINDYGPIWSIDADSFAVINPLSVTSAPETLDGDPNALALLPGRSAARKGGDLIVAGTVNSEPGLMLIHADPVEPTKGGALHIEVDRQSPYMKGNCSAAYAFESASRGLDSSHQANNLTASGAGVTGGPSYGVIGEGIHFDGVDRYEDTTLAGGAIAANADFTVAFWFKTDSATNPVTNSDYMAQIDDSGGAGNLNLSIYFTTGGLVTGQFATDGGGGDGVAAPADTHDALWHHYVFCRRDTTYYLYVDGVQVDSGATTTGGDDAVTADHLSLGSLVNSQHGIAGAMDDFSLSIDSGWTDEEVWWNYNRGVRAQTSSVGNADQALTTDDLDSISVDQRSGYIAVMNGTELSIWDEFGIMVVEDTPAGTGTDVAIKLMPGGALHYIMGDDSNIEFVQPDTDLSDTPQRRAELWRVPDRGGYQAIVDLEGLGDFHRIQDAIDYIDAGDSVFVTAGTHDNPVALNKANMVLRGSGRGTVVTNALDTAASPMVPSVSDVTVENMAVQSEAGGGGGGTSAINTKNTASRLTFKSLWILEADHMGISIDSPTTRVVDCYIEDTDSNGIGVRDEGDNTVIVGCTVDDAGGDPINIDANGENCVVVGNRTDGAVVDNSGTSTVASNDETAF